MAGLIVRALSYGRIDAVDPFERQMELCARSQSVVSAARVLDALEGGRPLPARATLLLFHDESSFAAVAWPIVRRHALAAALFVDGEHPDSEELRALAEQGVAIGLAGRGGPRRGRAERVRDLRRALLGLVRAEPGMPRLYAYPGERPDDGEVGCLREAGFELAVTALPGTSDLARIDPLRLRSIRVDPLLPPEGFRALALGPTDGPGSAEQETPEERTSASELRARRLRLRFVARLQDALLTAGVRPRPPLLATLRALTRRSSNYERVRRLADLATRPAPALERQVQRALLDTTRLPFAASGIELVGHGTAATVFRLGGGPEGAGFVLKVYRGTIGQPRAELVQMARRHRARYEVLRRWLGESVLRAHFLVLDGPLRALPVAACLQERVEGATDLLSRTDEELRALLSDRPELRAELVGFARRLRELFTRGFLPDLLGAGNLVLVERGARIRLLDYGLFDLRSGAPGEPTEALRARARRFDALLRDLEGG
jgi:hypothetical protein